MTDLERELAALLNKYGVHNHLNVPDYVLASMVYKFLNSTITTLEQDEYILYQIKPLIHTVRAFK